MPRVTGEWFNGLRLFPNTLMYYVDTGKSGNQFVLVMKLSFLRWTNMTIADKIMFTTMVIMYVIATFGFVMQSLENKRELDVLRRQNNRIVERMNEIEKELKKERI
jgi:hypothetical protein